MSKYRNIASAFSAFCILVIHACFGFRFSSFGFFLLFLLPINPAHAVERPTYHIALVSDPHVSDHPDQVAYKEHFLEVIREVNASHVDAVLMPGDLTQGGSAKQMEMFKGMIKGFNAKVWYVPGNHDVGNKDIPGQKTSLGERRLKNFEEHIGPLYFSADVLPGVRVVGITSSLLGSGLKEEQEQWDFLSKELPAKHGETVLLLTHYPPFVMTMDEPDEYFNMSHGPRQRLMKMLEDAGVRTILSGHLHRPIDRQADNVHIIGATAVSFGLPPRLQDEGWKLVTIAPDGQCTGENKYIPRGPQPAATQPWELGK